MGLGVSERHIKGIQQVAKARDFFLFIRPTEDDSLRLIDAGYATKSMDIHDKSSNWGPMAGFVPCDKAFCKRPDGALPRGDFHPHSHGLAHPIQLTLSDEVLAAFQGITMQRLHKSQAAIFPTDPLKQHHDGIPAVFSVRNQVRGRELDPLYTLYKGLRAPAGTYGDIYFCIDARKQVWWVEFKAGDVNALQRNAVLRPLWVWAYDVAGGRKPVTGDYDIWALVPHVSSLKDVRDHAIVSIDEKEHGKSASSKYYQEIADELNQACGRAQNTVFNHGAEAQNFGFTQKHDPELLMFPPGGDESRVRKIKIDQMPKVLAEIEHAGYLVLLNRQWAVERPKLMGLKLPGFLRMMGEIDKFFLHQAHGKLQATVDPAQRKTQVRGMWRAAGSAVINENRRVASAKFDGDRDMIRRWYGELKEMLPALEKPLEALDAQDFPAGYKLASAAAHELQRGLEELSMSRMGGGGENDSEALLQMMDARQADLNNLMAYWQRA